MAKKIESVEGAGAVYGENLRAAGCGTAAQLLKQGATRKGREVLAEKTGINPSILMRCVNMGDLFRINGRRLDRAGQGSAAGGDLLKGDDTRTRPGCRLEPARGARRALKL